MRNSRPRKDERTTREAHANRDMTNRKPYRTAEQKAQARREAEKGIDGAWFSTVPVTYHRSTKKGQP